MTFPKPDEIGKAVDAYNNAPGCGDEDERCWKEIARARELVLGESDSPGPPKEIADYAGKIRNWGHIRRVSRDDYPRAGTVLWRDPVRNGIHGLERYTIMTASLNDVVRLEENLVMGMVRTGVENHHYSWASKMLHFLLPSTMPVYDSYVREVLGTDAGIDGYRAIAAWEQKCAMELAPYEDKLLGAREPRTLLRAIDKFYWWSAEMKRPKTER